MNGSGIWSFDHPPRARADHRRGAARIGIGFGTSCASIIADGDEARECKIYVNEANGGNRCTDSQMFTPGSSCYDCFTTGIP